jgi:hypothetical protein
MEVRSPPVIDGFSIRFAAEMAHPAEGDIGDPRSQGMTN